MDAAVDSAEDDAAPESVDASVEVAQDSGVDAAPPCPPGTTMCTAGCVDPTHRTLDQSQLDDQGYIGLSATQLPGESFTVGASGTLTGIEIAVGPCNNADTTGQVQLEVFDSTGASRGTASVAQSTLPNRCGGESIVADAIGAGYFDLTPLCISAYAGDSFTFVLSLVGNPVGTCNTARGECVGTGTSCHADYMCGSNYAVGDTNCGGYGCDSSSSAYPGGNEVTADPTTHTITSYPSFEVAFKTFVQ